MSSDFIYGHSIVWLSSISASLLELEDSNVGGQNVLLLFFLGGGTWPSETQEENLQKMFEIFILEITANASNFSNELIYMENSPINTFEFFSQ